MAFALIHAAWSSSTGPTYAGRARRSARWSAGLLVLDPTVPGGLRRTGLRSGEGTW